LWPNPEADLTSAETAIDNFIKKLMDDYLEINYRIYNSSVGIECLCACQCKEFAPKVVIVVASNNKGNENVAIRRSILWVIDTLVDGVSSTHRNFIRIFFGWDLLVGIDTFDRHYDLVLSIYSILNSIYFTLFLLIVRTKEYVGLGIGCAIISPWTLVATIKCYLQVFY
jgi:hypothetical protein